MAHFSNSGVGSLSIGVGVEEDRVSSFEILPIGNRTVRAWASQEVLSCFSSDFYG